MQENASADTQRMRGVAVVLVQFRSGQRIGPLGDGTESLGDDCAVDKEGLVGTTKDSQRSLVVANTNQAIVSNQNIAECSQSAAGRTENDVGSKGCLL